MILLAGRIILNVFLSLVADIPVHRCLPGLSVCSWTTVLILILIISNAITCCKVQIFYDCFSSYSDVFLLYNKIQSKWKHCSKRGLNIQFIQKTQLSRLVSDVERSSLCCFNYTARIKLSFVSFQKVGKSNKNLLNYTVGFRSFHSMRAGGRWVQRSDPSGGGWALLARPRRPRLHGDGRRRQRSLRLPGSPPSTTVCDWPASAPLSEEGGTRLAAGCAVAPVAAGRSVAGRRAEVARGRECGGAGGANTVRVLSGGWLFVPSPGPASEVAPAGWGEGSRGGSGGRRRWQNRGCCLLSLPGFCHGAARWPSHASAAVWFEVTER